MLVPNEYLYQSLAALIIAGMIALSPAARAADLLPDRDAARSVILAPQSGEGPMDQAIRKFQAKIKEDRNADAYLVRLGWAFVSKARVSNDPGYYKLAELCVQSVADSDDSDALLLRGHIGDALHRFADAEAIARKLTDQPHARWESFALLGDTLMEQGKLEAAIAAYQRMIDIRPCLQTYARVAHLRWLKGDLDGALELMEQPVKATSTRDPEPAAWLYTRLGVYQLQAGHTKDAERSARRAQEFVTDYPAALVLQAKLLVAGNKPHEAILLLKTAVAQSPLPEIQWLLADVAGQTGDDKLAASTEAKIRAGGKAVDPRSFALFLATRNESAGDALKVAQQELETRRDVFTYDALGWASFAAGRLEDAVTFSKKALSEGTRDARLQAHAAIIASATNSSDAKPLLETAAMLRPLLLPSERQLLDAVLVKNSSEASASARSTTPTSTRTSSTP